MYYVGLRHVSGWRNTDCVYGLPSFKSLTKAIVGLLELGQSAERSTSCVLPAPVAIFAFGNRGRGMEEDKQFLREVDKAGLTTRLLAKDASTLVSPPPSGQAASQLTTGSADTSTCSNSISLGGGIRNQRVLLVRQTVFIAMTCAGTISSNYRDTTSQFDPTVGCTAI